MHVGSPSYGGTEETSAACLALLAKSIFSK